MYKFIKVQNIMTHTGLKRLNVCYNRRVCCQNSQFNPCS